MTIFCLGDSNTYGYDPTNFWGEPYSTPWPTCLQGLIREIVLNYGENGAEIPHRSQDFYWLEKKIAKEEPIDLMIIMLGSNDLLLTGGHVERICMRMEGLVDFLKERLPETKLLLLAPPQLAGMEAYLNPACLKLTEEYRLLAEQEGLLFADPKKWSLTLGADGLHLTEEAHARFAEELAKAHPEWT